ncbi:MAG: hypothetical protein IJT77_06380 [Clostridia bacterium]|nr:hypothetical protein [Clostridia bacterium]
MKNILCYGDSNTWGFIPASNEERYPVNIRWPGVLNTMLGGEYHVIEEGLNGRTTCFDDPSWPGRNGLTGLFAVLETHFPLDLIMIMLGTNDAKHIFPGKPYACGRAMKQYVRMIRGNGYGPGKGDPQILIVSPVLIKSTVVSDAFDPVTSVEFTQMLGDVYRKYAESLGVHFVDAAAFAEADDADGVHMNADTHLLFAERICKEVHSILDN